MFSTPQDFASVSVSSTTIPEKGNYFLAAFITCLIVFASVSLYAFPHIIDGDAVGYVNAVRVYQGEVQLNIPPLPPETTLDVVTVHRMLTTPFGIQAVRIFSELFGSIIVGWLAWDTILFFAINILFFLLLVRVFKSSKVAFIGGLFFAGNYSMVVHGLALFMDIGGWFFYVLSIFWLFAYIESGKYRDLLVATLAIAIGGLFKEYPFVASIPLAAILFYESYPSPTRFLWRIVPLGLIIAVPTVIQHVLIYVQYDYTYVYWVRLAEDLYDYPTVFGEYVKSFGSLLTFLAPLALAGAVVFVRSFSKFTIETKRNIFIISVVISSLPAVLWPAITQRVLFIVVPGLVLLACIFIKRYERYWWAFLPLILLYALAGFFMDSFILDFVNLPF